MFSGITVTIKRGSSEISCSYGWHLVWFLELLESIAEIFPIILELFELDGRRTWLVSPRLAPHLQLLYVSRIHTRFEKSCLLHFKGKWKQDQLIFVGCLHNNSWASRARYTDQNAPISDVETLSLLQFAHLICIWIHFRAFAKFEINFRNPLIGCQCFDFVCPNSKSMICGSKLTHSLDFCVSRITTCASWTQWRALDTTL